ncbi:MAG: hypothetical protein LBS53_05175 [Synergistaceae bacterium]|jgi:hypothetical protein|nr:hypothetical protein [Synergistaceae bacterium]
MKIKRKIMYACAVCLLVSAAGHSQALAQKGEAVASHCAVDETIIFACPVDDQRLLSVCASREYGPDSGYVQYRSGPADMAETVVPAEKAAPSRAAQSGAWMFSGGGGAYLRFEEGGTSYHVYTAIGRWGNNGGTAERAGALVEKDGKVVSDIRCKGQQVGELGPEFFEKAGLPEAESEFELPE